MSDAPERKQPLSIQCDRCGEEHHVQMDPQDLANGCGPEGWLIIRIIGFSTDANFELAVCTRDGCRDPVLKALGFESYDEYCMVVNAEFANKAFTDVNHQSRDSSISYPDDEDMNSPETVQDLLNAVDPDKDPWNWN